MAQLVKADSLLMRKSRVRISVGSFYCSKNLKITLPFSIKICAAFLHACTNLVRSRNLTSVYSGISKLNTTVMYSLASIDLITEPVTFYVLSQTDSSFLFSVTIKKLWKLSARILNNKTNKTD